MVAKFDFKDYRKKTGVCLYSRCHYAKRNARYGIKLRFVESYLFVVSSEFVLPSTLIWMAEYLMDNLFDFLETEPNDLLESTCIYGASPGESGGPHSEFAG